MKVLPSYKKNSIGQCSKHTPAPSIIIMLIIVLHYANFNRFLTHFIKLDYYQYTFGGLGQSIPRWQSTNKIIKKQSKV